MTTCGWPWQSSRMPDDRQPCDDLGAVEVLVASPCPQYEVQHYALCCRHAHKMATVAVEFYGPALVLLLPAIPSPIQ